MTAIIRIALAVLFLDELVVGGWNAVAPENFYHNFPTADLTPPFSEHCARDFGGATLSIALLLGIVLVRPSSRLIIPSTLAYSVFSVPHFFFHLTHLHGATALEASLLASADAAVALLGLAATRPTVVRDRRHAPHPEAHTAGVA